MATQKQYTFNGVLSTDNTVLQNLEILTEACNSFFTFDINSGKWSIVINSTGVSVASFNDSNIIGSITVSGTGLESFYNKVVVEFPHKDLLDQTDAIIAEIDYADFYPNEKPNTLNLSYNIINDPIQALLLGTIKLKQSRIDKIIKFRTDFTSLGLKAGELIDVTNDIYGYNNKVFRIITIEEEDTDEGSIVLSITALEYDEDVYNTSGLHRVLRTPVTGIPQKVVNEALIESDKEVTLEQLMPLALLTLLNNLDSLFGGDVSVGKLFSLIFDMFKDLTGIDLVEDLPDIVGGTGTEIWNTVVEESTTQVYDVDGVGVERFTSITFLKPSGGKVKMNITWPS